MAESGSTLTRGHRMVLAAADTAAVADAAPLGPVRRRSAAPIRAVQIFGQRCSGTNILARLVAANFGADILTDRFGFKHWFVPDQTLFPADVLVLVVAREAGAWVQSLHRQPWHAHPDLKALPFSAFIRAEWHSTWDGEVGIDASHPLFGREMLHERDPATGRRFANPLQKRTAKLKAWSALSERAHNVCLMNHETLAAAPDRFVAALGDVLERTPRGDVSPTLSYKGKGLTPYAPRRYPPLDPEDAAFIRSQLDRGVEADYGLRVA